MASFHGGDGRQVGVDDIDEAGRRDGEAEEFRPGGRLDPVDVPHGHVERLEHGPPWLKMSHRGGRSGPVPGVGAWDRSAATGDGQATVRFDPTREIRSASGRERIDSR